VDDSDVLVGKHLGVLVPDVRKFVFNKLAGELEEEGEEIGSSQKELEARVLLKNQTEVSVVMKVSRIISSHGKKMFTVCFREEEEEQEEENHSQVMFEAVLHSMLESAVVASSDMRILYVNPALCSLFGYTEDELIGEKVNKLMPKEMSDRHDDIVSSHLTKGTVTVIGKQEGHRVVARHKYGSSLQLLLCISKGVDRKGELVFTATFRDLRSLLARVSAEKIALSTQARCEAVLNSMLTPAVVADKVMTILFVNPATCDLFGYTVEELVGWKVNKLMPKAMADRHDGIVASHLKTGKATIIGKMEGHVIMAKHKDGTPLPLRLSVSSGCDDTGDKLFTATFHDLRENKARMSAEAQVVNTQARLEAVLNSMLEPAVVATADMNIVFINNAACSLFGYKRDKLIGHNVLMAPEAGARHDKIISRYLATGRARVIGHDPGVTVKARQKGGDLIPVMLSLSKGTDESGNLLFTATFRDLREQTRRIKAEQLVVSNQARFEAVLNTLLEPVMLVTKSMRILFCNQAAIDLFLFTEGELVGKRVNKLVLPQDRKGEESVTNRYGWDRLLSSTNIEGNHEVTLRQKSGRLVPALLALSVVPDRHGELIFCVTFSITFSNQAELRGETVLRSMLAPAVVATQGMVILFVNPAACDLFQYSQQELLGQKVNKLMPQEMADRHDGIVSEHLTKGKVTVIGKAEGHEVVGARKDGTRLPLLLSLSKGVASGEIIFTATFADR